MQQVESKFTFPLTPFLQADQGAFLSPNILKTIRSADTPGAMTCNEEGIKEVNKKGDDMHYCLFNHKCK